MANIDFVVTAKNATERVFDEISGDLGKVSAEMGKLASIAGAAVGAAAALGLKLSDTADEILRASSVLNVSGQELREWQYQAQSTAGITQDQLAGALTKLTQRAGDAARGNEDLLKTFAELGITQADLTGDLSDLSALFPRVIEGLRGMGEGYDQVVVAQKLFEEAGVRVVSMARTSEQELANLKAEFSALGGEINDEQLEALAAYKREIEAVALLIEQRAIVAVGSLAKAFLDFRAGLAADQVARDIQLIDDQVKLLLEQKPGESFKARAGRWLGDLLGIDTIPDATNESINQAIAVLEKRKAELQASIADAVAAVPAAAGGAAGGSFPPLESIEEEIERERILNIEMALLDQTRTDDARRLSEERQAIWQAEAEQRGLILAAQTEADRIVAERQAAFDKKIENQKRLAAAQSALQRFAVAAQGHKKLFELGKAAAIADAIVNTFKAVQAARAAAPPPLNYALAAIEAAAGAANVAAIQGASFGGGAATVQASGPGGYAPALPQPPANAVAPGQQQQGTVEVVVRGGDSAGQALLDLLSVEINQRDQVFIKSGSRQAAEIAQK